MYKKITLKDGLRIITIPQKSTEAVTVLVLVKTGSKYETKEVNGISHFLEHMFFKGTKKRPTQIEVAEALDVVGGVFNAFTGEEFTGYFAKTRSSYLNLAVEWVSDIFFNSIFPKKEMEQERKVIEEEIKMYSDNPMFYAQKLFPQLLYGDQPAGWDIAGTEESLKNITRQRLLSYRKKQYVAKNTIIVIAGNLDHEKGINLAKRYFSKISPTEPLRKPKVIENQTAPALLLSERKTDQAHLCLGVRTFNIFNPKRYALNILGTILGDMMSSRLFTEVRGKRGLAYHISTDIEMNPDTGYLVTYAGVDSKRIDEAIQAILNEYKKTSIEPITLSELKKGKENIKGRTALSLESSDALASFYGSQELLEEKISTPEEFFKEIDKVTREDILNVAREIFKPEKLNLTLVGPFKEKERFQKLLKL